MGRLQKENPKKESGMSKRGTKHLTGGEGSPGGMGGYLQHYQRGRGKQIGRIREDNYSGGKACGQ